MVWTIDDTETAEQYYKWGVRDFTTNALTQGRPKGNTFQKILWDLRDLFYRLTAGFRKIC